MTTLTKAPWQPLVAAQREEEGVKQKLSIAMEAPARSAEMMID